MLAYKASPRTLALGARAYKHFGSWRAVRKASTQVNGVYVYKIPKDCQCGCQDIKIPEEKSESSDPILLGFFLLIAILTFILTVTP